MTGLGIVGQLAERAADHRAIARKVISKPALLGELIKGLGSKQAPVKFGSSKVLRLVSEEAPQALYPHFDFFAGQLAGENSFLRWDATRIVANLARVDREGKVEKILKKYLAPIRGNQMIGAATAIGEAWKIARAKPRLADRIARAILDVGEAQYKTDECRNVAIGHAIVSLDRFVDLLKDPGPVVEFVREQLGNGRNATRKKAEAFLKRQAAC